MRSNANSLDPDETPRNSAYHPDPRYLTPGLQVTKSEVIRSTWKFEADENLADDNIRCMIRVKERFNPSLLIVHTPVFDKP